MSETATASTITRIHGRMVQCTFRNLLAMATELNAGKPLGFDPNRGPGGSWQGKELKPLLSAHMLERFGAIACEALLAKYEDRSRRARQFVQKNPGFTPKPIPMDGAEQATAQPMQVAAPVKPQNPDTMPDGAAANDEGTTVQRVREIAREEANKLDDAIRATLGQVTDAVNGNANVVADYMQATDAALQAIRASQGLTIVIPHADGKVDTVKLGRQHCEFPRLLKRCSLRKSNGTRYNIWLTGPAGSGKTTAAENVAKALKLEFHFSGAVDNEFKLMGFIDAAGRCIRTAFREAYEHGGIFLLDEVDGCHAGALLALNAALANGYCDFPDAKVKRHPDCVIIAAANTWGTGATHEYIGRNKLDAASLDRFIMMAWPYDEDMERDLSGNLDWCRKVQAMRARLPSAGFKHVISPRATYDGAAMLAAGIPEDEVLQEVVYKGLSPENIRALTRSY